MDDYRDADPASWPYGNDAPPAQVRLQRQRAASGPQPRFIPTGPQQRLAVTAGQPQAPDQPPVLQASEHPSGTFTAFSPWRQWQQRAQVRPFPFPGRETPFYNGMLRDRGGSRGPVLPAAEVSPATGAGAAADGRYRLAGRDEILPAVEVEPQWEIPEEQRHLPADLMPFAVAEPAHQSWETRQAVEMLPIPGCDIDSYLRAVDILTSTRTRPFAAAALPASGADYSDWAQRAALAAGIADATRRVAVTRPGKAKAYRRLREAVTAAWDYPTAERLVRNAAGAGLIDRDDAEAWGAR
jgi:hypothetical protein